MAGSNTRRKTLTTSIRLSAEEMDAVVAAAKARHQGPSTFARAATLRAAGRPAPAAKRLPGGPEAQALALFRGEMGQIGGLMKALWAEAQAGAPIDRAALRDVERAWKELEAQWLDWTKPRRTE
jgi:hypothetical protein